MMDLDKKYLSLPSIFQNNFEKSPSQIDLMAILHKKEDQNQKFLKIRQNNKDSTILAVC